MPSTPSGLRSAVWSVDDCHLFSHELPNGYLGIEYTEDMDSRFRKLVLGPLGTTVDLSTHDSGATIADVKRFVLSHGMNATEFAYVLRGDTFTKIKVSDATLVDPNTEPVLSSVATDMIYTKNAAGTEEISIALGTGDDYVVITAVGNAGADDTWADNDDSVAATIFGHAGGQLSETRIVNLEGQTVKQLLLDATVTMKTPGSGWTTRATVGEDVEPTGFALDGNLWVPGYDQGPYYLDNDFREFRAQMPEIDKNSKNSANMREWFPIGTLIPMDSGLRYQKNSRGFSIGPEVYHENHSPVIGHVHDITASGYWMYFPAHNPVTDKIYIVAGRPRIIGDPHSHEISYYTIAALPDAVHCHMIEYTGTAGGRSNRTLWAGYDDDVIWYTVGAHKEETEDTNYRYASSGTTYLTEMRRNHLRDKIVEAVQFEAAGCDANKTITVKLSMNGKTAEQIGAPVTTNGVITLRAQDDYFRGWRVKPQIEMATNSSSASPQIIGDVTVYYREVPREDNDGYVMENTA